MKGKLSARSYSILFERRLESIFLILVYIWKCNSLHTEKSFLNLIKSNRNQILFTILRLIAVLFDNISVFQRCEKLIFCRFNFFIKVRTTQKVLTTHRSRSPLINLVKLNQILIVIISSRWTYHGIFFRVKSIVKV